MNESIIDISLPLHGELPSWPGSPGFSLVWTSRLEHGDLSNNSRIDTDVHTGTHIDAPLHCIQNGKSVDQLRIEMLIGPAFVADLTYVDVITEEVLDDLPLEKEIKRLLFHTKNSELWQEGIHDFSQDYVALTPGAARWVVDHGIQVIGIDYLSIQRYGEENSKTHTILLENDVVIVEGLNLGEVRQGIYEFICLPIKIIGAEGAPARAILRNMK